jgi:DNA-directed RNA polymerase specialized sigma24 family protein
MAVVPDLTDETLRALLIQDPERGWRAFIEAYTPTLLALIAREGVVDRDDAADVYLRVCERLAENDCARLRRHDPEKGALGAWLTVFIRHAIVDWIRSRAGRRRLFRAVQALSGFDRRVFELYYWERQRAAEIAERLRIEEGRRVELPEVLVALHRIDEVMTDRHRRQLLAAVVRAQRPASLDDESANGRVVPADDADPERDAATRQVDARFAAALAQLPVEDQAIVRLTFVQGWSRADVARALHLAELSSVRLKRILNRLKALFADHQLGAAEASMSGLTFLEGGSE